MPVSIGAGARSDSGEVFGRSSRPGEEGVSPLILRQGLRPRTTGRRGRTAQSIRTVVRAAAVNDDVEVDVDFVDA